MNDLRPQPTPDTITGYMDTCNVLVGMKLLNPINSQRLRNHSPDGFSWGYGGSGPAQLALAILLELTNPKFALGHYGDFKWEVIAKLPQTDFQIPTGFVMNWILQHDPEFQLAREQAQEVDHA